MDAYLTSIHVDVHVDAVETLDGCVGKVVDAMKAKGGTVIITSDHGNVEQMIDYVTGQPLTAHSAMHHTPPPLGDSQPPLIGQAMGSAGKSMGSIRSHHRF